MYYCSARYYDPATQVFISIDPARADAERSGYLYCGGDPVNNTDPSGLYLRRAAVAYAKAWWNARNTAYYPSYTSDCANFVSQCVFAGDIAMTSEWKCKERWWVPIGTNYHFSVTKAWTRASEQAKYFGQSKYSARSIVIKTKKAAKKWAKSGKAHIGDLLYQMEDKNRVNHATIITKVDKQKGRIFYSAHSKSRHNANVTEHWGSGYWRLVTLKKGAR